MGFARSFTDIIKIGSDQDFMSNKGSLKQSCVRLLQRSVKLSRRVYRGLLYDCQQAKTAPQVIRQPADPPSRIKLVLDGSP